MIFFSGENVRAAVSPERALEAVREAFVAYARGEWTMPPKVYVPAYPAGDFRAMPALGAGHALLKWVTSFPGNPEHGLPTVTGLVLLSDASNGRLEAALDAAAVTALRTGAAAVLAAETLGRDGRAAVIGAGVNGEAAARTFVAHGREDQFFALPSVGDVLVDLRVRISDRRTMSAEQDREIRQRSHSLERVQIVAHVSIRRIDQDLNHCGTVQSPRLRHGRVQRLERRHAPAP